MQCDSSLRATRQIELAMHLAARYVNHIVVVYSTSDLAHEFLLESPKSKSKIADG